MRKGFMGFIIVIAKLAPKLLSIIVKVFSVVVKVFKGGTAVSMAVTFGAYAMLFSWQFAALILCALFVHEYGHVWAMRHKKMKVKGFYFIPFLGAAAVPDEDFPNREVEAYVALMGPVWGGGLVVVSYVIYLISGNILFGVAAAWMAMLNLFNLLPLHPLDGGRIFKSLALSTEQLWGRVVFIVVTVALGLFFGLNGLFLPLLLLFLTFAEVSQIFRRLPKFYTDPNGQFTEAQMLTAWKKIFGLSESATPLDLAENFTRSCVKKDDPENVYARLHHRYLVLTSRDDRIDDPAKVLRMISFFFDTALTVFEEEKIESAVEAFIDNDKSLTLEELEVMARALYFSEGELTEPLSRSVHGARKYCVKRFVAEIVSLQKALLRLPVTLAEITSDPSLMNSLSLLMIGFDQIIDFNKNIYSRIFRYVQFYRLKKGMTLREGLVALSATLMVFFLLAYIMTQAGGLEAAGGVVEIFK